jgi:hypothetical protein
MQRLSKLTPRHDGAVTVTRIQEIEISRARSFRYKSYKWAAYSVINTRRTKKDQRINVSKQDDYLRKLNTKDAGN